jgi:HEAT repeat
MSAIVFTRSGRSPRSFKVDKIRLTLSFLFSGRTDQSRRRFRRPVRDAWRSRGAGPHRSPRCTGFDGSHAAEGAPRRAGCQSCRRVRRCTGGCHQSTDLFQSDLDRWIPKIFEVLERENDSRVRETSVNALFQLRPPAFTAASLPVLVKGLGSSCREPRLCASRLLGVLGHDAAAAIPDLLKIMADPIDSTMVGTAKTHPAGWDPAWAAVQALSKIAPGTASAGEVIQSLTAVVQAGHPYRKIAAASALSNFGPAAVGAVPSLIDDVRKNAATKADFADGADAATALGRIAPGTAVADEAVSCLNETLQAESEFTREQAIDALLRFGPKAAVGIPRFRALVNDPHASVRAAAAKALSELGAIE